LTAIFSKYHFPAFELCIMANGITVQHERAWTVVLFEDKHLRSCPGSHVPQSAGHESDEREWRCAGAKGSVILKLKGGFQSETSFYEMNLGK